MNVFQKVLVILVFCIAGAFGIPASTVLDSGGVIQAQDRSSLEVLSMELWEKAGFALVVVTTKDIGEQSIEEYANTTYEKLGIGSKKEEEGALIALAVKQRKARIEVGYGSEGYINDAKAGRILDTYGIPYFRKEEFSKGLLATAAGIAEAVAGEKGIKIDWSRSPRTIRAPSQQKLSGLQIFGIVLLLMFLLGTRIGRTILFWMIITGGRGHSGGGFGGRMGGGGFGGGFGGGRSGGGGASRGF